MLGLGEGDEVFASDSDSVPLASKRGGTPLEDIARTSLSEVGVGVRGDSSC